MIPGVDLGYDGIQNDYPEMNALIPFKHRSRGRGHKDGSKARRLTPSQKKFNKALSKARVVVGTYDIKSEEIQHLRSGVSEQIETI